MTKTLLIALMLLIARSTMAVEVSNEVNIGTGNETQFRTGPYFNLSKHWALDTGVSGIVYKGDGLIGCLDTVVVHRIWLTDKLTFESGTGPALWTRKNWGNEQSKTLWTFSNRAGLVYRLGNDMSLGFGWRHYSDGFYKPNTSKDFIGLRFGVRL